MFRKEKKKKKIIQTLKNYEELTEHINEAQDIKKNE